MTKTKPILLISVTKRSEVAAALAGEADLIDLKNPFEGPLGAPSPKCIAEVTEELKGRKPLSIALGEYPGKPGAAALAALGSASFNPDYLKIGFTAESSVGEIAESLREIKNSLALYVPKQKEITIVAVAFADTLEAVSWDLAKFTTAAHRGGAKGCLIDTWEKKGKTLLDYLDEERIRSFIKECHLKELFCGLAGSLRREDIVILKRLKPDIIGVRSAACDGDRLSGTVSAEKVRCLKEICRAKG